MAQKTKKNAFYLSSAVFIILLSVFLFNYPPQETKALTTISCVTDTAVSSASYNTSHDLAFSAGGGNNTCVLTGDFSVNSVTVNPNVILTHTAENADGVSITTVDYFTLDVNASINVDEKGCNGESDAGGWGPNASNVCAEYDAGWGDGSINGWNGTQGAGHGGAGGLGTDAAYDDGGLTYGSPTAPILFGSSGGPAFDDGGTSGDGGGLIILNIGGTFTHDGSISANAGNGSGAEGPDSKASGGGSGGSINITANSITGSGDFAADGGNGGNGTDDDAGGGGGGVSRLNMLVVIIVLILRILA